MKLVFVQVIMFTWKDNIFIFDIPYSKKETLLIIIIIMLLFIFIFLGERNRQLVCIMRKTHTSVHIYVYTRKGKKKKRILKETHVNEFINVIVLHLFFGSSKKELFDFYFKRVNYIYKVSKV